MTDRKKLGSYVRRRGNNYELKIAHELEELGYEEVLTSRSESKRMDDAGVDLIIPGSELMIQCKRVLQILIDSSLVLIY